MSAVHSKDQGAFAVFLEKQRHKQGLKSVSEQYKYLGGSALGINERSYLSIAKGERLPQVAHLVSIFSKLDPEERGELVVAYFKATLQSDPESAKSSATLLQFLESVFGVTQSAVASTDPWIEGVDHHTLDQDDLKFLNRKPDALRFFKKVRVLDRVAVSQCKLPSEDLETLIALGLIKKDGNSFVSGYKYLRIPVYGNADPMTMREVTRFWMHHLDFYISREGSERQTLTGQTATFTPENAQKVLQQLNHTKSLIYSLAEPVAKVGHVPMFVMMFGKKLTEEEL